LRLIREIAILIFEMSGSIVQFGELLDNDSPQNFAQIGEEYLEAAKVVNSHFKNAPRWPTYSLAFQSLESYLKSYLLARGKTLQFVHKKIGHDIKAAYEEAKKNKLVVKAGPGLEASVMAVSESYTNRDFHYRSIGSFTVMPADSLINFVEAVCVATGNQPPKNPRPLGPTPAPSFK
jgi:hypothetical protein